MQKLRKCPVALFFILFCTVQLTLFAGGSRETPARHNIYANLGATIPDGMAFGAGYEGAIGNYFSLGPYIGGVIGDNLGFDLLIKPRVYFNSALERFFIGANLGLVTYIPLDYDNTDFDTSFAAGVHSGYKFVFGSGSSGFSLEPSIGYDFLPGRLNIGVALGFAFGGNAGTAPEPRATTEPPVRNAEKGTYFGIIGFNDDLRIEPLGVIKPENASRYKNFIDGLRMGNNTALFHAVYTAIDSLEKAKLPNDLSCVAVVTFTDGLDNISHRLNSSYRGEGQYQKAVSARIRNARFQGLKDPNNKKISAYSIGLLGRSEGGGSELMNESLESIASEPRSQYVFMSEAWASIESKFQEIAREIYSVSRSQTIGLTYPPPFGGYRIRFTFDAAGLSPNTMENSRVYIEGVYTEDDVLTSITYRGLKSGAGSNVRGVKASGSNSLVLSFKELALESGGEVPMNNLNMWKRGSTATTWVEEVEFDRNQVPVVQTNESNAAIILVLDCSNSLGDEYFNSVQTIAKRFIDILTSGR